jgi:methionyl-tRNA synthetase
MEKKKKYLITSALPYINGIKHLGNLIGSILPADVYAKYLRQEGCDVLYICGTDEHGTPAEIAAQDANLSIEEYCAKMYETQKDIYEQYGISFDYFGRSSSFFNHQITHEIYLKLKENDYVFEKEIQQYYSHTDKRFLPDRYVEGTCYICGYEKARGDQCDGCGSLLDPEKLINPYSSISGSQDVELRSTKHIFLNLWKLQGTLQDWIDTQEQWPDVVKGIARKWINEGLQPRCITRDLKWGVKVPEAGYEEKVFYVWFDAPNAYISMTKDWAASLNRPEAWRDWWLDQSVHYTQFMAKDNVPFHAIFWPAVLFGSNLGFKQVDYIKGFHWLTYDKGKFSTSQKRGVFTDTALTLYPADYWRYYLIAHCPETADSDFCFSHFASVVNKDLADILGNFCNRVLSLFQKYHKSIVPLELTDEEKDKELICKAAHLAESTGKNLSVLKFRNAAQDLRALWVLGNEYITQQQPWSVVKTNPRQAAVSLVHCIHLLRLIAIVSYPFIPYTSQKILQLLNDESFSKVQSLLFKEGFNFNYFMINHTLSAPERLFEKIEDSTIQELTLRFS